MSRPQTKSWLVIATVLGVGFSAAPSRAADPLPGRMPPLRLPSRMQQPTGPVVVGSWAEYSIHDTQARRRLRLHMALVKKRGHYYWWEMTFRMARLPVLRMRLKVRGKAVRADRVKRVIVQSGTQRPLILPLKKGQQLMNLYIRRKPGTHTRDLGIAQITTPAGRFAARHLVWTDTQGHRADEWSSKAATLWGLVRYRGPRFRMELIGQGKGARSQIRGVPAKWHLPGL